MFLSHLHLQHFRSYSSDDFVFHNGLTLILGENGKGKTNILEAIYSLATIKPFRNPKKEVFIQHEHSFARISGTVQTDDNTTENLSLFWGEGTAFQAKINDIPSPSAKQYLAEKSFLAILFAPEDLFLPFLSPSHRRNLLTRILAPLHSDYFSAAVLYEKALKQRNALLKKKKEGLSVQTEEFIFWETKMSETHDIILQKHHEFFHCINQHISTLYTEISSHSEEVLVLYHSTVAKGQLQKTLRDDFMQDIARGSTSKGVHRDDFMWHLRNLPLEESASRGETRSVMLAFKKAQQHYMEIITQKKPVILLDDVFSELDISHQEHLLASLQHHQCIITTTEMHIAAEKATIIHL